MLAILILGYRRYGNVERILNSLAGTAGLTLYVHIDSGKDYFSTQDSNMVVENVINFRNKLKLDIRISKSPSNQGIAVSMINSLNEIFKTHEEVVILEDDCLPAPDFLKFMRKSFELMKLDSDIAVACGVQFAPTSITNGRWVLSQYPLNWGWGINRDSWNLLLTKMLTGEQLSKSNSPKMTKSELAFWNAGCRRALNGYSDVWDTLLLRELVRNRKLALLPGENLITNTGNEKFATHTRGENLWTDFPSGQFFDSGIPPSFSSELDVWLRKTYFRISFRHFYSTKISWVLDALFPRRKIETLANRLKISQVNFDL